MTGEAAAASFEFTADLWRWHGEAAWCFVTLPHDVADELDELAGGGRAGFGSVRVEVTVGATTWSTSLFPDRARASYLLPVKRAVRDAERLHDGSAVRVALELTT